MSDKGQAYENETSYNAGLPDLSSEQISVIYDNAGLDIKTGLPKKRGIASGSITGGILSVTASQFELRKSAEGCGCATCLGALLNLEDAIKLYARVPSGDIQRRWARQNRAHYIIRLRDIVFSDYIQHNNRR